MPNSPSPNESHVSRRAPKAISRSGYVADDRLMLLLLAEGHDLARMSRSAGWPARSIQIFASRHGYLFGPDSRPYQPPALGERQPARRRTWSAS